jgi:ribosomal protein S18 acetylase RimI-like enzyme
VEHQVRAARVTDVERLVALCATGIGGDRVIPTAPAADLLRQLVYIPHASVLVAEAQRQVVGGAVLTLRPSVVAGGYIGSVDFLVVDGQRDAEGIADALIEEVLRSARNKGCVVVEVARPDDDAADSRWSRHGFQAAGPRLEHSVAGRPLGRPTGTGAVRSA